MRAVYIIIAFIVLLLSASVRSQSLPDYLPAADPRFSGTTPIEVQLGLTQDGRITETWYQAIKERVSADDLAAIKAAERPLSADESKWLKLIRGTATSWTKRRSRLHLPFGMTRMPTRIVILAGNQIGDDGFTFGDNTICLDLAAFAKYYGDPSTKENADRILRMLDHEYTHLVHHAWIKAHPVSLSTPYERALRDLWVEGIGNYRSLSDRWVDGTGDLTPLARQVLSELEAVFVDRVTKLKSASEEDEEGLRNGLSRGPFAKKWGALTMALWFAQEARGDDRKLAKWIERGPRGVMKLAGKYLPNDLKEKFRN